MTFACFFKVYLIVRVLKHFSLDRAIMSNLAEKMDFRLNDWFIIKTMIIKNPWMIILTLFFIFVPLFAMMIRLAELPYIDISDKERAHKLKVDQLDSNINAYYMSLCCLFTLGLGDFFASTMMGRAFATMAFIIGNSIFGLTVYAISQALAFTEEETRASQMISKETETVELHSRAGDAIRNALELNRLSKKRDGQAMGKRF